MPRRGWKTVTLPEPVYAQVKQLAERQGKAAWQVVEEAVSFYEQAQRSSQHYTAAPDLDKLAYYILKLTTATAYYKQNPSQESLAKLEQVIQQLAERLAVDCTEILPAAKKLLREPTGKNKHTLNMATKNCIKKLINMA